MSIGTRVVLQVAASCIIMCDVASSFAQTPLERPVIHTQDDLPRHRYPVVSSAAALLDANDETFNAFAAKVASDANAVLGSYLITDHATRRRLLATRASYEMLTERNEQALETTLAIRALEDKPDARLMSGLREEAILRARMSTGANSGPAFDARFATLYRDALAALPFEIVGTRLKEIMGKIEVQTLGVVGGYIANKVEPVIARERAVCDKPADDLLWARTFRKVIAPTTPATLGALRAVIAANKTEKADIWSGREVALTPASPGHPVTVAVWDSGIDLALFPGRAYIAPGPVGAPNNGHGISFDVESRPTTGILRPLSPQQLASYAAAVSDFQGYSDNDAAIDSPFADALRAKMERMTAAQSAAFFDRLSFYGDYGHGTHVAGIVARGNPFVRLAVIRDTLDTRAVPAPPTAARIARRAALYSTVSAWVKANRVRVVNMSWGETPDSYEHDLEANGAGGSVLARKVMARRLFDIARKAFVRVLIENPNTLFVASAGNTNTDPSFDESYPAGLIEPNLLVVSAVDQSGDETGFTSNGRSVAVSANGYRVRSYLPGGTELAESGTSMAGPNVVNLAAKLIALRPELAPAQVVSLIKAGATPSTDGRRRNIDPKTTLTLLSTSLPPAPSK